jgi:hypothetical protein
MFYQPETIQVTLAREGKLSLRTMRLQGDDLDWTQTYAERFGPGSHEAHAILRGVLPANDDGEHLDVGHSSGQSP